MRVTFRVGVGVRVRARVKLRGRVKTADMEQFPVIVSPTLGGELALGLELG